MKLNHECVRDTLLYVEKNCIYEDDPLTGNRKIHTRVLYEFTHDNKLSSYDEDDIHYTIAQLLIDDMLIGSMSPNGFNFTHCEIKSLSPKGHKFLDTIRDDSIWKKTKEHVSKLLSSTSISTMSQVASKIAMTVLTKQL